MNNLNDLLHDVIGITLFVLSRLLWAISKVLLKCARLTTNAALQFQEYLIAHGFMKS